MTRANTETISGCGSRFIQEVGKALGLRHDTMATAAVYFHRFYSANVFKGILTVAYSLQILHGA